MTDKARTRSHKPAVGYAPWSTDRQEQSLGDQRKAVEAYAQKAGYDILDWYTDYAISGAGADDRAAFLRMIQDAQQSNRPFDYILVYDVRRFGRLDNDETGHYRYLLRKAGAEVVYVAENFNGDDTDDLLLPVKQWQARQGIRDLSKVTLRRLLSKADGGSWMGGTPPFGYDLAYHNARGEFLMILRFMPDGTKQVLNEKGELQRVVERGNRLLASKQDRARLVPSTPERVEIIQNTFQWYVRDGLGFKSIADRLNTVGAPSPRNGCWSAMHSRDWAMTTIRDLLMNPAYAGEPAQGEDQQYPRQHHGGQPGSRQRAHRRTEEGTSPSSSVKTILERFLEGHPSGMGEDRQSEGL
jgi:DNA invertase Pin-like site-specific DNA recombinase